MKSRRILSIIGLILAAAVLLGIGFAIGRNEVQAAAPDATDAADATGAVRSQDGPPPKELWYLGGAPILDDFYTTGGPEGPEEPRGVPTSIVIYVPLNLVQDGFSAGILGMTADGESEDLLLHKTLPTGYYTIPKDVYEKYESMTLLISYSWQGELMSMRSIDLFTHEDVVPMYPSRSR